MTLKTIQKNSEDNSKDSEGEPKDSEDETTEYDKSGGEKKIQKEEAKGLIYMLIQSQEHWETEHPFAYYSQIEKGWLFKIYTEYGVVEYWRSKGINLQRHSNGALPKHQESPKHIEAMKKWQECEKLLSKRNIYKQLYQG